MIRRIFLLLAVLCVGASPGRCDIVILTNGASIEGTVEAREGGRLRVRLPGGGSVTFDIDQVSKVIFTPTIQEQYEKKKRLLKADDLEGYFKLGLWCRGKGLKKEAEEAFRRVLKLDPDHEGARKALGYVRDGEEWVTVEEYHRRRGEVLFEGRWIAASERERILARREAKKRLSKLRRLVERASGRTRSAFEARRELGTYPPEEVVEALLRGLKSRIRTRIFAARELARYKLQGVQKIKALKALVDQVVNGGTAELRAACLDTLKTIKYSGTALLFCPFLYKSSTLRRIYAVQALFAFPDLRVIEHVIRSLPLAVPEKSSRGGIVTGVSAAYVKGYQLIPAATGRGGTVIVLPRIGRIRTGIGLSATSGETVEDKQRKAELYLRVRLLEELTGKNFGYNVRNWIKWWKLEGRQAIKAQIKAQEARRKTERNEALEREKPPPAMPD